VRIPGGTSDEAVEIPDKNLLPESQIESPVTAPVSETAIPEAAVGEAAAVVDGAEAEIKRPMVDPERKDR
jgi:hypothetical protein